MGHNQTSALAIAAITILFLACAYAQAPASAPTTAGSAAEAPVAEAPATAPNDCFNSILNMTDCLTFVEMGSKVTKPDKMCCPELAGLVESNPICLCQLLGNSGSIGIQIDINKALQLPTVCKVTTPPVSLCSAIGIPVGAPMASEGPGMPGMAGAPGALGGTLPTMSPDMAPPAGLGVRSIMEISQLVLVGLSSVAVATLF